MLRAVLVSVGIVLVLAACGKLFSRPTLDSANVFWRTHPFLFGIVVAVELLVGTWCLSGLTMAAAWLAALGAFHAFALASGYLVWGGETSCGCMGAQKLHPLWIFFVDLALIAGLWLVRPTRAAVRTDMASAIRAAIVPLAIGACLLVLLGGTAWIGFGSVRAALARLSSCHLNLLANQQLWRVGKGRSASISSHQPNSCSAW